MPSLATVLPWSAGPSWPGSRGSTWECRGLPLADSPSNKVRRPMAEDLLHMLPLDKP